MVSANLPGCPIARSAAKPEVPCTAGISAAARRRLGRDAQKGSRILRPAVVAPSRVRLARPERSRGTNPDPYRSRGDRRAHGKFRRSCSESLRISINNIRACSQPAAESEAKKCSNAHLFIMAGSSWWGPYATGTAAKGALEQPVPAVHFRHPLGDPFRGDLRLSGREPRRALGGLVPRGRPRTVLRARRRYARRRGL